VWNNNVEGVPGALVTVAGSPAVTATTGAFGEFSVGVPATGTYTLTATRSVLWTPTIAASDYGPLPPMYHVVVLTDVAGLELMLPPADDEVLNGDFEGGDPLAGWHVGGDVPPTVTTSAHTGHGAALLGNGAGWSWLTQTVSLSDALISPTLSFAYAFSTTLSSGTFEVWAQGAGGQVVSVTQTAVPTAWTYVTGDLGELTGTVTLYFRVHQSSALIPTLAWLDEVHVGSRAGPLRRLYLPLVQRAYISGP
jgi:hypothetical protein